MTDNVKNLNNNKLNELLLRREQLLKDNPELQKIQFKYNDLMAGAGNTQNRLVLSQQCMLDSMKGLKAELDKLQTLLNSLIGSLDDEK
jgi:hypothetical protein